MEHRIILGGEQYLPFARSCVTKLKKLGLKYASQSFEVDGVSINVKITPGHDYIRLEGGELPLYQFFTTGPDQGVQPTAAAVPGYAVRVKLDKDGKLVGAPTGSTAEESPEDPPAWRYSPLVTDMTEFMTFKGFQVNGLTQHQFFMDAKGPRFIKDGWVAGTPIGDVVGQGMNPVVEYARDALYDASVYVFEKAGQARGNRNGFAPDADWYRRGAARRVSPPAQHPEYGERFLAMLTDVSGNFYVFPVSETEPAPGPGEPYANQTIKTTIPDGLANVQKLPYPSWARPFPPVLRRDAWVTQGFNAEQPHGSMRWEFSSDGKRMVCLIPADLPSPIYGPSDTEPTLVGQEIRSIEGKPGLLELGIEITLTGPEPEDFDVTLKVLNEVGPDDERYFIAAQYYWGDLKDAHAPTGLEKDELIVMDLGVYHQHSPTAGALEPGYLATRTIAKVRSFEAGTVVREFTTYAADAPWGMVNVAYNDSFLKTYTQVAYSQIFLVASGIGSEATATMYGRIVSDMQQFITDTFGGEGDDPLRPVTPALFAEFETQVQAAFDELRQYEATIAPASTIRRDRTNTRILQARTELGNHIRMTHDSANVVSSLLACDLRALAFAVQTAAFHNDGPNITRQDRVQVIMRNEVVHTVDPPDQQFRDIVAAYDGTWEQGSWIKLDHRREMNPSTSMFAFLCVGRYRWEWQGTPSYALDSEQLTAITQAGFNAMVPVGAVVYNRNASTFVCSDPFDIFCVHPAGHWSITTRPVIHYTGLSRHARYGPRPREEVTAPDADQVTQHIVDIVSVQVTERVGEDTTRAIKSSHLDLINEAYGKTWKPEDFHYKVSARTATELGMVTHMLTIEGGTKGDLYRLDHVSDRYISANASFNGLPPAPSANITEAMPTSYMDARNYFEAPLSKLLFDNGVELLRLSFRMESYPSLIRGAALFGGTTIKLK